MGFDNVLRPPSWHDKALCAGNPDPELWWYDRHRYEDERALQVLRLVQAIEICNDCPVRLQCLEQGLTKDNIQHTGVWGGLLQSERVKMKNPKLVKLYRAEEWLRRDVRKRVAKAQ